jgi:hypothetical protein
MKEGIAILNAIQDVYLNKDITIAWLRKKGKKNTDG